MPGPRAALDRLAARDRSESWFFPPPPGNSYWTVSAKIARYRPARWWRRVKAPVLLVYGGHDQRIPAGPSIRAIRAALKAGGRARLAVRLFPDADHTFTIVQPPRTRGWPRHVPDYADLLTRWGRVQVR